MNRNKQRAALRGKREIGFHTPPDVPGVPLAPTMEPEAVTWQGAMKVQYAQEGAEAYLVYNEDRSIMREYRRGQYSRADWNKLLERLGLHPKRFWAVQVFSSGRVEFVKPIQPEAW